MSGIFILIVVIALIAWLIAPGVRQKAAAEDDEIEPVDEAELEAAETEVRDLEVNQRPEDGFEGDDWGPGTAKNKD